MASVFQFLARTTRLLNFKLRTQLEIQVTVILSLATCMCGQVRHRSGKMLGKFKDRLVLQAQPGQLVM
jgi:hypothetical protein